MKLRASLPLFFCGLLLIASRTVAQEAQPAAPPSQATPAATTPKSESSSDKKKSKRELGYLVTGTVFTENALAFPGVRVQIRRENEKKFRWDTHTNSRGEFATRVPEGQEYEVVIRQKKYKEASRKINASNGELEQRLSIRLETVDSQKDAAKK
jgi:Carboxypeptidase regulatory-like domain